MDRIAEIKQALKALSPSELENLLDWLGAVVEDVRHGASHVGEARFKYGPQPSEEPLLMTFEQYMAFEEQSPLRHECVNGSVHAMAGVSLAHNAIAVALVAALEGHLQRGPCKVFALDARLEIQSNSDQFVYYPDLMVACRREDWTDNAVRNPKLVVEILSPSTHHIDRREKAITYRRVASIEEYVLVDQNSCRVIVHRRDRHWRPDLYCGRETSVELGSIGLSLPLARINAGIPAE